VRLGRPRYAQDSLVVAAILVFPGIGRCRPNPRQDQQQTQGSTQASAPPAQAVSPAPSPRKDVLADAARKAREQKKEAPKASKIFTNDDLPVAGGISAVGSTAPASSQGAGGAEANAKPPSDEKAWRERFAGLRHKLEQDQAELDVLQREAGVAEVQYYNGDPMKAEQDQTSNQPLGAAYNKKVADIDAKKKQVEADKQAISDAEDDLHKAGGDPGWAR